MLRKKAIYISTEISKYDKGKKIYKYQEGGLKILQKNGKQKLSTGGENQGECN